jgi:predicted transcriptional regulator
VYPREISRKWAQMSRDLNYDRTIKIRLSEEQIEKLEHIADECGTDKSKIIRDQIDSLPDSRKKKKT